MHAGPLEGSSVESASPGQDRRAQLVRMLLVRRNDGGPDPTWEQRKFATRARALFWARLAFLFIGFGVLAIPSWSREFGIQGPSAFVIYVAMLLYAVASYFVLDHPTAGRLVTFVTLCLDTIVVVYLIVASGGLRSPLLATQLMLTTVFVILFPKPLYSVPPLLTLPVIAKIDQLVRMSSERVFIDLLVLVWFSALNFVVVYVLVYLNEREDARHREVVQLQGELRELAVIEERSRLAREIHDGLGASLSSLIIQAEYVESMVGEGPARGEVRELKSAAEEAIDELRRSLKMMRDDFDLVQAAEDHCRTFEARSRMPIAFERTGPVRPVSQDGQLALFRVLQEALTNAVKHAGASGARVRLAFESNGCTLLVQDDGKGFDPDVGKPGHFGLLNMRERAKKCAGEVSIRSAPGQGTEIRLTVPYRTEQSEQEVA